MTCQVRATTDLTGYLHPGYAAALAEFGTPICLPRSGGWLLRRRIPGTDFFDAMGTYPYLACVDWASLATDLDALQEADPQLVSVSAAPDPFGSYDNDALRRAFPDLVNPYKQHLVADLEMPDERIISEHHAARIRRAKRKLAVEVVDQPLSCVELWTRLFEYSVRQFSITGIQAFSPASFARQLAIPGTSLWLVHHETEAVAAAVTMSHDNVAYTHLLAASPLGRKLGASYVIYDSAIRHLRRTVRWIDWGAVPGDSDGETGLKSFKAGWSTGSKPAYICGRITNRKNYELLAQTTGTAGSSYFPCYRASVKMKC